MARSIKLLAALFDLYVYLHLTDVPWHVLDFPPQMTLSISQIPWQLTLITYALRQSRRLVDQE
jgi:hypothetical protein